MSEIQKDLDRYFKFMISGNVDGCIAIEKKYELFGCTPEEVTSALAEAAQQPIPPDALCDYAGEQYAYQCTDCPNVYCKIARR